MYTLVLALLVVMGFSAVAGYILGERGLFFLKRSISVHNETLGEATVNGATLGPGQVTMLTDVQVGDTVSVSYGGNDPSTYSYVLTSIYTTDVYLFTEGVYDNSNTVILSVSNLSKISYNVWYGNGIELITSLPAGQKEFIPVPIGRTIWVGSDTFTDAPYATKIANSQMDKLSVTSTGLYVYT